MILVVLGTRPEIVKMASVIGSFQKSHIHYEIARVMQHYDWKMSGQFLEELGYPKTDHVVYVDSSSQASQMSAAAVGLERTILKCRPNSVLVQGDTNTVLAAALAAVKLQVSVCHVEAGLRSYDLRMPEEHNRRIVDHVSSFLFAPTTHAAETLTDENVWGRIGITGNTVIDACLEFMKTAIETSSILDSIRFDRFALATIHRAESVDHERTLRTIVKILIGCPLPVVFPVHPRTMKRLKSSGLIGKLRSSENIQLMQPASYLDLLRLLKECAFILTDSGGIQEEASAPNIRKFTYVLRRYTDRPESVKAGFARVMGTDDSKSVLRQLRLDARRESKLPRKSPYGDGRAGVRIARLLKSVPFVYGQLYR
jgi:UDP-N-acetylglucosamine 2-epimerase (non-hydrolysing)